MAEDTSNWLPLLLQILPADRLRWDEESLDAYAHDETEDLHVRPQVVCVPESVEEVSAILKVANAHGIPVTPAAARTGLSGEIGRAHV